MNARHGRLHWGCIGVGGEAIVVGQLSRRVLLVDDEPRIRRILTGYLVAAGYVVRAAVDGLDALQKLRTAPPDLIISDLNLPRMSGVELLHVVRQRFPHMPVIAITAGDLSDDLQEGIAADAYFQKGELGFDDLLQSVARLTQQPNGRTATPTSDSKLERARLDGNGRCILHCPECLRSFSMARSSYMGKDERWTTCVHCGSSVQFLLDAPDPAQRQ